MLYTNEAIKKRNKTNRQVKNAINVILYIILSPILIYNITLIMKAIINSNETPTFFGIKTYVIISGSMEPTLNIGDIIIVKKAKEDELKVRRYYFF